MKKQLAILIPALSLFFAASVSASGGGGGYSTGGKQVDRQYELGKSYYKSRQADGSRLAYCVKTENDLKKLSRRSVKPFKFGSAAKFANSLHNCDNPEQKIADLVGNEQGRAILHYLNKRYKLQLQS